MSAPVKHSRCTPQHACHWLADRTSPYRAKGFATVVSVNLDTGKERWLGVAYHKSAKDPGLMLNQCPFCGGRPGEDQPKEAR